MKTSHLIAAAIAATVSASSASAQTFSGPRVEGRVGWDGTSISIKDTRDFGERGDFGASGSHASEISIGGEVGFDVQTGSLVFGAYAGADFSDVEEEFQTDRVTFEASRNLALGARLGFTATPNVLVYGKGGYSNARLEPTFATGANQTPFADLSEKRSGFHFGGGLEVAQTSGLYVRADYTHTKYKDFDLPPNREFTFNRNQVTAAIGFRF